MESGIYNDLRHALKFLLTFFPQGLRFFILWTNHQKCLERTSPRVKDFSLDFGLALRRIWSEKKTEKIPNTDFCVVCRDLYLFNLSSIWQLEENSFPFSHNFWESWGWRGWKRRRSCHRSPSPMWRDPFSSFPCKFKPSPNSILKRTFFSPLSNLSLWTNAFHSPLLRALPLQSINVWHLPHFSLGDFMTV